MTTGEVGEQRGEAYEYGDWEKSRPVGGQEVLESRKEEARGLLLGRKTQEVGVQLDKLMVSAIPSVQKPMTAAHQGNLRLEIIADQISLKAELPQNQENAV